MAHDRRRRQGFRVLFGTQLPEHIKSGDLADFAVRVEDTSFLGSVHLDLILQARQKPHSLFRGRADGPGNARSQIALQVAGRCVRTVQGTGRETAQAISTLRHAFIFHVLRLFDASKSYAAL